MHLVPGTKSPLTYVMCCCTSVTGLQEWHCGSILKDKLLDKERTGQSRGTPNFTSEPQTLNRKS